MVLVVDRTTPFFVGPVEAARRQISVTQPTTLMNFPPNPTRANLQITRNNPKDGTKRAKHREMPSSDLNNIVSLSVPPSFWPDHSPKPYLALLGALKRENRCVQPSLRDAHL